MKAEMKIDDNAKWYYANLDSLLPQYRGKYVAITDGSVFGSYDDCATGVLAIEKAGHKRGTFIVHKCIPLEDERKEWTYRLGRVRVG